MAKCLIDCVSQELRGVGVIASREAMHRVGSQIILRGWQDFDRLARDVHADLRAFQKPVVRSLGTGALITEFAIAGIEVETRHIAAITALGGLATLIVSAFDVLLDECGSAPVLFPEVASGDAKYAEGTGFVLLRELVDLYFRRLQALPNIRPEVRALNERAIRKMYDAEVRSAASVPISRTIWWRKNVLPFVVMGLPVWMPCASFEVEAFRKHLYWLSRLGEFFGWLDDCVDYEEDCATGRANRIDSQVSSRSVASLSRKIALQAQRIMVQWDASNRGSTRRDVFAVMVWSWIENTHTSPVP